MIGTETKLWKHLQQRGELLGSECFDRIESPITPGASDVTYAGALFSGWIELKTAAMPRPGNPLKLKCEFTMNQFIWLINHHDSKKHLQSWVLIGFPGSSAWRGFCLVSAPVASFLLEDRRISFCDFLKRSGVYFDKSIATTLQRIRSFTCIR